MSDRKIIMKNSPQTSQNAPSPEVMDARENKDLPPDKKEGDADE